MYGLFPISKNSERSEKYKYAKHMCALCDSLHDNYGIKGRFFTNFDVTTFAVIFSSLDEEIEEKISECPKILCIRPISHNESPDIFKFLSAISVMLAYCREKDKIYDEMSSNLSKQIINNVKIADEYLGPFKMDVSFFEEILLEQHKLERKDVHDINVLSSPTGVLISKILTIGCEIINKTENVSHLQSLGVELGKLVYVYDGLLDYQEDNSTGSFNCIEKCFVSNRISIDKTAEDVQEYVKRVKEKISSLIELINFYDPTIVRQILLQDITVTEKKSSHYLINALINKSTHLNRQVILGIISGNFVVQSVVAYSLNSESSIGGNCCSCCCYCWLCYIFCGCLCIKIDQHFR